MKVILLFYLVFLVPGSTIVPPAADRYDLAHPDASYILPHQLHEISGITILDTVTFASVQDENGIIFIYDLNKRRLVRQIPFASNGDYEGIVKVGNDIYVLRSDGTIFEVADYELANRRMKTYMTGVPLKNNEGLCYDAENNRLLIGGKSKPETAEYYDSRLVFAFNLESKQLEKMPVYKFSVSNVLRYAIDNDIKVPVKYRKKGKIAEPFLRIGTSEIAIHPRTGHLYLLSSYDKMLMVFDRSGSIIHLELLDPMLFNKPEGIAFFENGDMLISNEGQRGKPSLHRFNYKN